MIVTCPYASSDPTEPHFADTSNLWSLCEVEIVPDEGVMVSQDTFATAVKWNEEGPPKETSIQRDGVGMYGSRGSRVGGGQL